MAKSIDFSGQSAYIEEADQTGLNVDDFTMMCWLKTNSVGQQCFMAKAYKEGSHNPARYAFRLLDDTGVNYLTFTFYYKFGAHVLQDVVQSGVSVSTDVWTHVAIVFTAGNGEVKFYKNGVLEDTQTVVGSGTNVMEWTAVGFSIGASGDQDGVGYETDYFDGKIFAPFMDNAAQDATFIASKHRRITTLAESAVAFYEFKDNLEDSSPETNHLTANGTITYSTDVPFIEFIPQIGML